MLITAVVTATLRIPNMPPKSYDFPHHALVVARIRTDEGIEGLGYTLAFGGGGAEAIRAYAEFSLKPVIMGADPLMVGALWERMFRADRGIRRSGIAAYALSAIDIGLWDIAGKAAGLPLYRMWGAVRDRVPAYGSGGWGSYSTDDLVEEALGYVRRGCRYYKLKIHDPDPLVNRSRVEAVRRAVGDDVGIMVDVNQKLDVAANLRQAEVLQDLGLTWYEEPVLADDLAGCAEVARAIRIPVATGENNYTRFEFRDLAERRAARYFMPDVGRANGFSETLRIGQLAAAYGIRVTPHVLHELSSHVAGALANAWLVEWIDWVPEDLFERRPAIEGGSVVIPNEPGHGMGIQAEAFERYGTG
jgi:L-alanine-DL-glutamate epimerase-like enolase superfamily enzyme